MEAYRIKYCVKNNKVAKAEISLRSSIVFLSVGLCYLFFFQVCMYCVVSIARVKYYALLVKPQALISNTNNHCIRY